MLYVCCDACLSSIDISITHLLLERRQRSSCSSSWWRFKINRYGWLWEWVPAHTYGRNVRITAHSVEHTLPWSGSSSIIWCGIQIIRSIFIRVDILDVCSTIHTDHLVCKVCITVAEVYGWCWLRGDGSSSGRMQFLHLQDGRKDQIIKHWFEMNLGIWFWTTLKSGWNKDDVMQSSQNCIGWYTCQVIMIRGKTITIRDEKMIVINWILKSYCKATPTHTLTGCLSCDSL